MESIPHAEVGFLQGPLEPLPGHEELILADPPPPPSVTASTDLSSKAPPQRSVAMKRSVRPVQPIADDDDDSDEEDDDYAPPSAKARRTNEESSDQVDSSRATSAIQSAAASPNTVLTQHVAAIPVKRRKTMDDNVGPRFQADVPDEPLPVEEQGKDKREELAGSLLWEPGIVSDEHVSRMLLAVDGAEDMLSVEKTLNLLRTRQYDYKSLTLDILYGPPGLDLQRRTRRDILNKEEQRQFKEALMVIGKDFHLIAKCMQRSVHDLLEYYYLWKKNRKFHASVEHIPYQFYVDATIRLPRLVPVTGTGNAKAGSAKGDSSGSGESDDSSADCKQS